MSLADLPDVLIAHLCSYLDYPDICNLMETSKKNYYAIKGYKKDKLNVDYLHLNGDHKYVTAFKNRNTQSEKRYQFNGKFHSQDKIDNMLQILDKCSSIEDVRCDDIDDDFCKAMLATKTPIVSIRNIRGSVYASPELFISLWRKIKHVYMKYPAMNGDLFTDEVFIESRPGMQLEFETEGRHISLEITDRTLEDLVEKNFSAFELNGVTTSFTIKGIAKALQTMRERKTQYMFWLLGVLLPGQRGDANRYFNPRTGELRNQFKVEVTDDDYYHITNYQLACVYEDGQKFGFICFSVSKR